MAQSKTDYVGNGSTTDFTVPFPFISRTHVVVKLNGVIALTPLQYSWVSNSTIKFVNAPAVDAAIEISRTTPRDTRLVDFQNGAVLTEAELDLAHKQTFFIAQEIIDNYDDLLGSAKLRLATGAGVQLTEAQNVIDAMVQEVLNSSLLSELLDRTTDIDTNAQNVLNTLTTINDEIADRLSADASLQSQINTIAAATAGTVYVQATEPVPGVDGVIDPIPDGARWYDSDDNNKPFVYDQGTLTWLSIEDPRIGANAADIVTLEATVNHPVTGVDATATALSVLDTTVTNLDGEVTVIAQDLALIGAKNGAANAFVLDTNTVKLDSDAGVTLATKLSALVAEDSSNAAAILTEQGARVTADSAIAADLTALTTTVDGNTASITTQASSINGLEAKYTVKVDVNGHVAGFGLASVDNDGAVVSEFIVAANKFAIVDPGNGLSTPKVPFAVSGGVVSMQNVVIGGALIEDASIGSAKISSLSANLITTGTLNASRINLDGLTLTNNGGTLQVGKVRGGSGGEIELEYVAADSYLDGTRLVFKAATVATTSGSYVKKTTATVRGSGTIMVSAEYWSSSTTTNSHQMQVRQGSTILHTESWQSSTLYNSWNRRSFEFTLDNPTTDVDIYIRSGDPGFNFRVRNFGFYVAGVNGESIT